MSFINKIEDTIEAVAQTIAFDPRDSSEKHIDADKQTLSFPKILDFAFPQDVSEEFVQQVGEVTYVGDGVVRVSGLDKATIEEVLLIKTETTQEKAFILGVTPESVEAVIMGDYTKVKRGQQAVTTGARLQIPSGNELIGRVIDPLGNPIDGLGSLGTTKRRDVEFPAPGVMDREPIDAPMHTGIMVIDSTIPIGKGQRELIVGDRKTGKTRTMLDVISNQKGHDIICVYVGIGVQAAKAKGTVELLRARGALDYTALVMALANQPPTLQYIAPYAGVAIAEAFMYEGKNVLIVYDDLSKQAKAYRQVSLLLKRSPGRDAYPGDIFFLHSRLLERSAKVSRKLGLGSITALPIAETQGGDLSDYIITNLMSITDGHVFLDANMMNEGVLPAVNSGASVSRIGSKVQTKLLARVGELASRILARYAEVKSFETINTEVAEETLQEIKRGKRIKEIFSQESALNLSSDEQVAMLAIACSARMDELDLAQVETFKKEFTDFYRQHAPAELKSLLDTAKTLEEVDPFLDEVYRLFSKAFALG